MIDTFLCFTMQSSFGGEIGIHQYEPRKKEKRKRIQAIRVSNGPPLFFRKCNVRMEIEMQ
jgi:hypothetical protein